MRAGFKYTTKYVEHKATKAGQITKFSTGEKMQGTETFVNWKCTMFGELDIQDGDRVIIDSIESIDAREYNGKMYYDVVVKAHKIDSEARTEPTSNVNPFDI